jgi:hypothetical protein
MSKVGGDKAKKYTKTDKKVKIGNRDAIVYGGQRGGEYVKMGGEYINVRNITKELNKKDSIIKNGGKAIVLSTSAPDYGEKLRKNEELSEKYRKYEYNRNIEYLEKYLENDETLLNAEKTNQIEYQELMKKEKEGPIATFGSKFSPLIQEGIKKFYNPDMIPLMINNPKNLDVNIVSTDVTYLDIIDEDGDPTIPNVCIFKVSEKCPANNTNNTVSVCDLLNKMISECELPYGESITKTPIKLEGMKQTLINLKKLILFAKKPKNTETDNMIELQGAYFYFKKIYIAIAYDNNNEFLGRIFYDGAISGDENKHNFMMFVSISKSKQDKNEGKPLIAPFFKFIESEARRLKYKYIVTSPLMGPVWNFIVNTGFLPITLPDSDCYYKIIKNNLEGGRKKLKSKNKI